MFDQTQRTTTVQNATWDMMNVSKFYLNEDTTVVQRNHGTRSQSSAAELCSNYLQNTYNRPLTPRIFKFYLTESERNLVVISLGSIC